MVAWFLVVIGLTLATVDGSLKVTSLASSPVKFEQGKVWFLLTSGLIVQHPIAISLLSFVALAVLVLAVCGQRLLWVSAVAGHVGSTVLAYSALATVRVFDPSSFQTLLSRPDYGVSAVGAAWLGAIAAAGWRRRGQTARGRIAIGFAVAAVAVFAYMLRGGLTILDSDHVLAFGIGIALVVAQRGFVSQGLVQGLRPQVAEARARSTASSSAQHASRV
ncbi:MAG TPA: hypothetical protein VF002_00785 [Gaiellaceae bacterium]